jgi:hypothetical protein
MLVIKTKKLNTYNGHHDDTQHVNFLGEENTQFKVFILFFYPLQSLFRRVSPFLPILPHYISSSAVNLSTVYIQWLKFRLADVLIGSPFPSGNGGIPGSTIHPSNTTPSYQKTR